MTSVVNVPWSAERTTTGRSWAQISRSTSGPTLASSAAPSNPAVNPIRAVPDPITSSGPSPSTAAPRTDVKGNNVTPLQRRPQRGPVHNHPTRRRRKPIQNPLVRRILRRHHADLPDLVPSHQLGTPSADLHPHHLPSRRPPARAANSSARTSTRPLGPPNSTARTVRTASRYRSVATNVTSSGAELDHSDSQLRLAPRVAGVRGGATIGAGVAARLGGWRWRTLGRPGPRLFVR